MSKKPRQRISSVLARALRRIADKFDRLDDRLDNLNQPVLTELAEVKRLQVHILRALGNGHVQEVQKVNGS